MRSSKSPTESFPLLTHVHAANSLKQLRAAEGGNKRNNANGGKKSRFSHTDGKVEEPFRRSGFKCVCVQVCVWRGESLCALSVFGGGFLSALEEQRV